MGTDVFLKKKKKKVGTDALWWQGCQTQKQKKNNESRNLKANNILRKHLSVLNVMRISTEEHQKSKKQQLFEVLQTGMK